MKEILKKICLILFLAFLFLTLGCINTQKTVQMERDLIQLKMEVEGLKEESKRLETKVQAADLGKEADIEDVQKRLSALYNQLEELQRTANISYQEVNSLKALFFSNLEELTRRVDQMEDRFGIKKYSKRPPPSKPRQGKTPKIASQASAESVKEEFQEQVLERNPKELYQDAYETYKSGDFIASREKFRFFIQEFPDTPYSDDAQFYIAECLYDEGKFEDAILSYQRLIDQYPKSERIAQAILKQGFSFIKMDFVEDAKKFFQVVINRFPKSPEAKIARKKLKNLN